MSLNTFSQGFYNIKNPEKYVGTNKPYYRSSWELTFCMFCDNNPSVQQWASESIKIPYRDPLTGKQTVYVPDFFVVYVDKNNKKHAELVEIKPEKHMLKEKVGKNPYNQAQFIRNQAKWTAANNWCKNQNIRFRVVSEHDIYHTGKKKHK